MDLGLRDRVFIVTGATRGLGLAAARQLAAEGARVVVSGRQQESVDKAVAELGGPSAAVGVVADNAGRDTPQRLIEAAESRFGRLDGVLVSVGGPTAGTITDVDEDHWRDAFESVFMGALRIARAAAAALGEGGVIGFVLSSSVREPIPGLAVSNGLRPGLAMAAKTLADELGPRGIRVVGLLPARIDTQRVKELDALGGQPEEARAHHCARIPLRRYGTPDEFGRVAAFLLSPAASYLTGLMVPIDGGAMRTL